MRDVNELCQMTGKMDKVLASLCYTGLFLLGKEINRYNWIWGLYCSIMVNCYMHPTAHTQREYFEEINLFRNSKVLIK